MLYLKAMDSTRSANSNNPFIRAASQLAATGAVTRPESKIEMRATRAVRAVINHFPDESELGEMIRHAITALGRGLYWDRGSIVNIVV
jgi:hypothetical protein